MKLNKRLKKTKQETEENAVRGSVDYTKNLEHYHFPLHFTLLSTH